ncbi:CLUMA_CG011429, isoform A [Clunio marinus]|uniref:CLUMA_CG011429, isoform A n=1 Tax=Clunio marinus TaxID=568069 RepID=A0A1J1IES9_9DIPT|nr:CLUMA_CG011429, isoform A [Clunio marinus]
MLEKKPIEAAKITMLCCMRAIKRRQNIKYRLKSIENWIGSSDFNACIGLVEVTKRIFSHLIQFKSITIRKTSIIVQALLQLNDDGCSLVAYWKMNNIRDDKEDENGDKLKSTKLLFIHKSFKEFCDSELKVLKSSTHGKL